ncbi:helix-turn-helix domain-containing protein [Mesorhizobium sp.]|uniref:helix-turn-helix domain-containing protein n=1 Tax=Mesorhizobium sp. TaxID=1871066 RepID=UPI0025B92859|nr:helix-turn-helix transcriptional regulator [Mesorhizobium sp.]
MLGLSDQVYSRYENAVSRLTVGRLLHICEVLSISPVEILFPVAPHLWGEARPKRRLVWRSSKSWRTSTGSRFKPFWAFFTI